MNPEEKARLIIDEKLQQSGWVIQDMKKLNLTVSLGIAVREFPTSSGPVDYALFVEGVPVGVVEAQKSDAGENITMVEEQSARYADSTFKWIRQKYRIRFAYEATDKLVRFTDYDDIKYRSRTVFSFHRPETLKSLLAQNDTVRNHMKHFPELDAAGFRQCQINAIHNIDISFAENRPKALIQMATGAGKTFTAITAAYRLLKYGKMNRIFFWWIPKVLENRRNVSLWHIGLMMICVIFPSFMGYEDLKIPIYQMISRYVLVLHPASSQTITGYSLANLVRASCVLNCQLIFTLSALRLTVHIRTCCLKLSKSGHGFPNACRLMIPISISAMSSQLPCFGV